jgi:hypothetical protein
MARVVIAGAGWAGCAAAVAAVQAGGEAVLVEKADTILGTGQVGGIFRNNGRFTAAEEMIAMGGGAMFHLMDDASLHQNMEFPGHKHSSLYDVAVMEPTVRRFLQDKGVDLWTRSRITNVVMDDGGMAALKLEDGTEIEGDAFIDTTGTAGSIPNCRKYGYGCAECVLRCITFGNRVSVTAKAGVTEVVGRRMDGTPGAMSGSCKLHSGSVSEDVRKEMKRAGVAVLPIPKEMISRKRAMLAMKVCQQYALPEFADNVVLLDTGHVKLMSSYFPIDELREIKGLENARYEDPYAGGIGNSVRFMAIAPREDTLKVNDVPNLLCAGEKAGLFVGHTEAIATGTLAGYNAVRCSLGKDLLTLPRSTAVGEYTAYGRERMETEEGLSDKFTFSGSVYFNRMNELGTYTTDVAGIHRRVEQAGVANVFMQPVA